MARKWFLDDKEVPFSRVIEDARQYGYESDSGLYCTSEAAAILEANGISVRCEED